MGIYVIRVPDIGEGIAEVELVAWHVALGESVKEDQPVADVMTDKASVEIPCHVHGKVIALGAAVGQMISVGAELIRLETQKVIERLDRSYTDGGIKAGERHKALAEMAVQAYQDAR